MILTNPVHMIHEWTQGDRPSGRFMSFREQLETSSHERMIYSDRVKLQMRKDLNFECVSEVVYFQKERKGPPVILVKYHLALDQVR
ncbi:hypothetical protein CEXT_440911 [Caerostris extrusa]|uniref:Uncharacterized protein n=1 Tax=Caerostris extrusa TaxID=172846 RepID=A0AAV4R8D1_CAEEX|nr:hypothetical protein CEXT_440911 [Caerostris extrusa]